MDPETFTESKLILLWGTNPLTSGHHVFKFIRAAQKVGLSLEEIKGAMDSLPEGRTPTHDDWQALASAWRAQLDERINQLIQEIAGRHLHNFIPTPSLVPDP